MTALDLADLDDPRVLAIGRVPAGSRVLLLGVGDGQLASALRTIGCSVRAAEPDPVVAELARQWCDAVVVADLARLDLADAFGSVSADVVVLVDVLGHVPDPAALLRGVAPVLTPDGWGVISLRNVGHASVRLSLLEGRFPAGTDPVTPIRFFDRAAKDALLDDAGWVALDTERVTRAMGDQPAEPGILARLAADEESLTWAWVVLAVPAGSPRRSHPPFLPAATAQALAVRAQARAQELEATLASVGPGTLTTDVLLGRLEAFRQGSQDRRESLRVLLQALEENLERMRLASS